MFVLFVVAWLIFGAAGSWRHLRMSGREVAVPDALLALLLLLSGPLGLLAHSMFERH